MKPRKLAIHSFFTSLQGEGRFVGVPTAFLRLAQCNLSCAWCDAHEAATGVVSEILSPEETARRLAGSGLRDICITGGEPLLQEETLTETLALLPADRRITIETNGALPIAHFRARFPSVFFSVDWKTPSSGEEDSFDTDNLLSLGEQGWLKFVVADARDLDFVAACAPRAARYGIEMFVSPVFEKGPAWFSTVATFVTEKNPTLPLRFQLQLHKVLGIP